MSTQANNSQAGAPQAPGGASHMRSARRSPFAKAGERVITGWIYLCGFLSIILVVLIFLFVFKEALPLLREYPFASFFLGTKWIPEPARGDPRFGLVPLLASSLLVTLGAIVIAVPLGLATAVYMSEIAPVKVREYLKPAVELLAAVPSVVLGFFGVAVLASLLQDTLHLPTGKTMLAGSVTLAFMAVPTIATISEDAINAVPRDVREGSYGLGATHWETIWRVLLPAAFSGIVAAVMLGVGRAIGETMVVLMVTGNGVSRALSDTMAGDFHRVFATYLGLCRTITATIAAEMGEVVQGGEHYRALFMLGVVLFLITFLINLVADFALRRAQRT